MTKEDHIETASGVPEQESIQQDMRTRAAGRIPALLGPWTGMFLYVLFYSSFAIVLCLCPSLSDSGTTAIVFTSLAFSFSSLLGIWVNLGHGPLWRRLTWAGAGMLYCPAVMVLVELVRCGVRSLSLDNLLAAIIVSFILSLSGAGVAAALFLVRRFGKVRLVLLEEITVEQRNESLQFSLRGLMGVTVAVAILLAISRSSHIYDSTDGVKVVFASAVGVLAILVTLTAVWAALGVGRPIVRIAAVVSVAACLGATVGSCSPMGKYSFFAAFAIVQVIGVAVPLFVVRSYGHRLVRCPQARLVRDSGKSTIG